MSNVKTSGSITAGAITIPNSDGTKGQVLATDGSGTFELDDEDRHYLSSSKSIKRCNDCFKLYIRACTPGDEDEEDEHGDDHGSTDYPEFLIQAQSCITDAFAGI